MCLKFSYFASRFSSKTRACKTEATSSDHTRQYIQRRTVNLVLDRVCSLERSNSRITRCDSGRTMSPAPRVPKGHKWRGTNCLTAVSPSDSSVCSLKRPNSVKDSVYSSSLYVLACVVGICCFRVTRASHARSSGSQKTELRTH